METTPTRLNPPPRAETLLESFVTALFNVPGSAHRLRDSNELPDNLRRVAASAQTEQRAWGAWTGDRRLWFFTAELSERLSNERGWPVMRINTYDEDGQIEKAGFWEYTEDSTWRRWASN